MELIVAYNNDEFFEELVNNLSIKVTGYSENKRTERKKAFDLKGSWSARKTPFALLKEDDVALRAFYSEDNSCTVNNIIATCIQMS